MPKLEQLAALVAGMGAPVRHVPKAPVAAGVTVVADVAEPADAEALAALYNLAPALLALAQASARIDARAQRKVYTVLATDRKAIAAALAKLNA